MMQIVIDIDDVTYNRVMASPKVYALNGVDFIGIEKAIYYGTPLPEHHGRLIDADRLTRAEIMHLWYHLPNGDVACSKIDIDHAPTIIEADKGSDSE